MFNSYSMRYLEKYPFSTWGFDKNLGNIDYTKYKKFWSSTLSSAKGENFYESSPWDKDFDGVIRRWWQIALAIQSFTKTHEDMRDLQRIIKKYGFIPDISIQVLSWASRGPASEWEWLIDESGHIYRGTSILPTSKVFDSINDPLVADLFVRLSSTWEPLKRIPIAIQNGEKIPLGSPYEAHLPMQFAFIRLWSLKSKLGRKGNHE